MAQKVTVALEDDLDGGPADETVRFGLSGVDYEIDLSKKNATAFRTQLAPSLEHARKTGRGQPRRAARTVAGRQRSGDIRAWAQQHGIAVSERAVSRPAWLSSSTPRPRDADANSAAPDTGQLPSRHQR